MARVEGGAVIIDTDWPGLKNQIDVRNINFKYEEDSTAYEIFAIDGQYFYRTTIYKSGQAPENQATYDTWRTDFENNYKNRITDFNSTQPVFITTIDGYSIVLKDGVAPTANDGYGIAVIGLDGSNYRMLRTDTSGRPVMVGAGTAGTPAGGIITIQGHATGTPIPVSGNITASNASVSDNDLAIPLFSNLIGGSDGTNLRPLRVFDVDSGGGQQWVLGVGLRKAAGGGSVEFGTSSDPIRTDPTGSTTQPVSGTVTANQGGAWTVAATQSGTWTVQPGNTANTTPWLITINEGGNSATVTASNALKVDGSAVTQPISGTVTANAGTGNFTVVQSTASNLRAQLASESSTGAAIPSTAVMVGGSDGSLLRSLFVDSSGRQFVVGAAANGAAVAGNPVLVAGSDGTDARSIRTATDGTVRVDPTGTTTQPVSGTVATTQSGTWTVQPGNTANTTPWLATINQGGNSATVTASNALKVDGSAVTQPISSTQLPAALVGGRLDTNVGAWLGSTAPTVGQKTMSNSLPIAIASDQTAIPASQSGTWTVQQGTPPWSVVGAGADGAAVTGNPVRIAGSDGTNTQDITTDTSGRLLISGAAADGSPVTGNPVLMAGQDGINTQSIFTDTIGRQVMVGASPDGSAVTGNPVLMGGQDGTNAQSILTDTSGRQVMVGAAADGAAVAGNPVLIAGQDGTDTQSILTDTSGRIIVASAAAGAFNGFSSGEAILATTTVTAIRNTTYTEPSSGAQRSMASANANDTSAGTGARTVKITYYTLNAGTVAGPFTETITLNGTTPVNTVATDICYIEKLEVVTVGSGGVNAGIITLYGSTGGGGGTIWTIAVGANQTKSAHHYVPSNIICSITSFNGGIKGADTSGFIIRAKNPTDANSAEIQISDLLRAPSSGNTPIRIFGAPIEVSGPARITAFAVPDSTSSRTYYASFDFYEE